MRLIDANALLHEIDAVELTFDGGVDVNELNEIIHRQPTIDPVKHGRWRYTEAHPHWMFCDQCFKRIVPNKEWIKEYNIPTNYCPNCGARMDGEEGVSDCTNCAEYDFVRGCCPKYCEVIRRTVAELEEDFKKRKALLEMAHTYRSIPPEEMVKIVWGEPWKGKNDDAD